MKRTKAPSNENHAVHKIGSGKGLSMISLATYSEFVATSHLLLMA